MLDAVDLGLQFDLESPVDEAIWHHWFAVWIDMMAVKTPCELSLSLTTDEVIGQLNHDFRQINSPTDVLAFAAQEAPLPTWIREHSPSTVLGDIVISLPTAQVQAEAQGHSLLQELAWLASHGLLHLLGWDHPDDASLERMLAQQQVGCVGGFAPTQVDVGRA